MVGLKDIFPTIAAVGASYVGWLALKGKAFPFALSNRWIILGLLIIGIVACATGGSALVTQRSAWTVSMSILGGAAAVVAIVGILKPWPAVTVILASIIVLMWILTTIRHIRM